jgi:hypothetical protein
MCGLQVVCFDVKPACADLDVLFHNTAGSISYYLEESSNHQ